MFFLVLGQLFVWLVRKWSCGKYPSLFCVAVVCKGSKAYMVSIMMYNKYHLSLCRRKKETSASSLQSQLPPKAFLIQYHLRLHVPLSFSDTLFIKWARLFRWDNSIPCNSASVPHGDFSWVQPSLCLPCLFFLLGSFLIITVYHYNKILFPLRVNNCIS